MIFDNDIPFENLPPSDPILKQLLNYNPPLTSYTARQAKIGITSRSPDETDRGGWRGYDRVYSKYLKQFEGCKFKMLEIGIYDGYGLLAWRRYFPSAELHGLDIIHHPAHLQRWDDIVREYPQVSSVRRHYFDSTNSDHWLEFYGKQFDVIIDDGGHHPITQLNTLKNAWQFIKPGGLYFIEDVGHRYGKDVLDELSHKIDEISKEGHEVTIYSHFNSGLQEILNNPKLRSRYKISPNAGESATEYIVAIKKLDT